MVKLHLCCPSQVLTCNCSVSAEFNKLTSASPPPSSQQPLLPLLHYFMMFLQFLCWLCHSFVTLSCSPSASPPSLPRSLCSAVDAHGLCVYLLSAVRFYDPSARTSSCVRRSWVRGYLIPTRQGSYLHLKYGKRVED